MIEETVDRILKNAVNARIEGMALAVGRRAESGEDRVLFFQMDWVWGALLRAPAEAEKVA